MGVTRSDLFTQEQNEFATLAKAFAHPARVAILQYLLASNKCINGDLVSELGLAQATISQHLKELKNAGLIQGNIEGVSMSYCINPEKWESVQKLFNGMFDKIQACEPGDCC
ncbi:metalloregulator ArsR/SmtB family transcription factor [Pontixanthobacter gangjinensis]|uniref:Winged helix-turn-helix transcriptional regulator n=1 Tax=Christiangramia aestuarii TaxID=1028746 RepID=A0A7M3SX88_9FLAO|nr:metalloregulator ArsR/SmtB family transcription factor [Christiangramia aestuarii]MUP41219.1 winged helix-turn-helix transcriptional regulator [Christiangramia aestuarii]